MTPRRARAPRFAARPAGVLLAAALSAASCAHVPPAAPPAAPPRPPRVALALGAGASKGFAHIGVLKVLEASGIPVYGIAGTSAGSFVGALYAAGYDAYTLQKIAFAVDRADIADLTIPDNGFIKGEKLEEYVNRMVRGAPIEALRIPFRAVATDLRTGAETVFATGNTGMAVRASCAVPGVFRPVRIGDRVYVDGGVTSPVPVDAARRLGADVVIAVDISGGSERSAPETTIETILRAVDIMYGRVAAQQLARADVVVRPHVGHIASGDFSKRHEAILEGEKAARDALPAIRAALSKFAQAAAK